MTLLLSTQYPGKADVPSAGYPQGSFKNVTAPGAGDGTPWEKVWVNDWAGFFQRLISEASITPSGSPDTILAGDNWDALASLFQRGIPHIDSGTGNAHVLVSTLGGNISAYYNGFTAQYPVNILNTGAVTANVNAIGAKAIELPGGIALTGGELNAGQYITIRYNLSDDKFYIAGGISELTLSMEDGIELSNNTVDPAKDIDFSVGSVCDSTKNSIIKLPTIMVKQLDAAWVVGTNAGGLFTGTIAATTWYHCFTIEKDTDRSVDCGFDTSIIAANRPAGYSKYRYRGSILTDATPDISGFIQHGDLFLWDEPPLDINATNPGTSAVTRALSTPLGVRTVAHINSLAQRGAAGSPVIYFSPLDVTDLTPSVTVSPLGQNYEGAASGINMNQFSVLTNILSQIRTRISASDATTRLRGATVGYTDLRGKE